MNLQLVIDSSVEIPASGGDGSENWLLKHAGADKSHQTSPRWLRECRGLGDMVMRDQQYDTELEHEQGGKVDLSLGTENSRQSRESQLHSTSDVANQLRPLPDVANQLHPTSDVANQDQSICDRQARSSIPATGPLVRDRVSVTDSSLGLDISPCPRTRNAEREIESESTDAVSKMQSHSAVDIGVGDIERDREVHDGSCFSSHEPFDMSMRRKEDMRKWMKEAMSVFSSGLELMDKHQLTAQTETVKRSRGRRNHNSYYSQTCERNPSSNRILVK